ncbi:MAG: hypothetical protein EZS28_034273 [Streblomastix strix]|uniref:Uncharacterized protein n=1 Tax=Streblomastix strix TaxID=222440 RepID=A0A5J4UJM3_9EUKA|nr:MAG: hypothetical protein EZS28_034273 [Streblomastix strix]
MKEVFKVYCIETVDTYSLPTKVSRFTIPSLIQNVSFEKRLKIIDTHEIDEDGVEIIKTLKLPILTNARLLSTLMIFDDIGSNTDIQRYTSELSRTVTHLVSDSRHAKNTLFFVAQRPSYLFKTARILYHVIVIGQGISDNDIKQSIGIAVVHSIGLLDYLETYITALRAIVKGVPENYGLASSLNIVNNVQVDDDEVLRLECVTYIDIQALPLYVVTQPQANDSYIPRVNDYLIAYSIGGVDKGDTIDPTFHTPSVSYVSTLQPVRTKLSQFALFFINLRPQLRISLFGSIII